MAPEPMRQLEDSDNLEKRVSVYKDIVVTGVRDVPDSAAICTAAISGQTLTKEESARLVRKIDLNLMPLLCSVYLIQFVSSTLRYTSLCLSRAFHRARFGRLTGLRRTRSTSFWALH